MNLQIQRAVRSAIFISSLLLPFGAIASEDGASDAIDTITIFGRQADVADVPGSAHKIDSEELETGDLPLEKAMQKFEEGIKLTRGCQAALKDAEQKVEILLKSAGSEELEDFDVEDD